MTNDYLPSRKYQRKINFKLIKIRRNFIINISEYKLFNQIIFCTVNTY